jgi:hypothetical protein
VTDELSDEERHAAAAGDLTVLAVLMFVGSAVFAAVNYWLGTLGWIAALATATSTAGTALGLLQRNPLIAAFTKIGFGVSGLATPVLAIAGVVLALFGVRWGWALAAGSLVYFGFSLLGLEILERAEDTGVIDEY